ncbi:MAG TPA: hypothetical protein VHG08_15835 [Longimicrobium sp.]|nr:hypothetical protein [Longimicrobium sp.]
MAVYPDAMTLGEARARFFARWGLGPDGGYGDRWVRVETKPIPVYFPNTRSRVDAAKLHDLHHVATGYGADWPGEAQIAAWEIAGGCGRYGWAWLLNLGAFTIGIVLWPRRLFRAFVHGSRASNLYHTPFGDDQLATVTVGELRRRLGIAEAEPQPEARDRVRFAAWCAAGLAWYAAWAMGGAAALYLVARAAGLV